MSTPSNVQFNRAVTLVVGSSQTGAGINLSDLRFTFETSAGDTETPNTAIIKVFNLNDDTRKQIIKEFDTVLLQGGYQGNVGLLFNGTIKQFKRGKDNNVDSYLMIMAADSDLSYNFGVIAQSFQAGSNAEQRLNAYAGSINLSVNKSANPKLPLSVLPRGKVALGMTRSYLRELARASNARFSIQNGKITLIPLDGYLPGQAVKLTSATGLVRIPTATDNGIELTCLLNPKILVGFTVQLDNKEITATLLRDVFFPGYRTPANFSANTENDGLYRVLVVEHSGDTRGDEWYTRLICLQVDFTDGQGQVKAFG